MRIKSVLARFYKSFNYDYLRRSHPKATPASWEYIDDVWHPYVRVTLEPQLTTVVGANESGKSHLLSAIEKALTGIGIVRADFCRYSPMFGVRKGQVRLPDLGLELTDLTDRERSSIAQLVKSDVDALGDIIFLRDGGGGARLVAGDQTTTLSDPAIEEISALLPVGFRIDSEIALPASVALSVLGSRKGRAVTDRAARASLLDLLIGSPTEEGIKQQVSAIASALKEVSSAGIPVKQRELAKKLFQRIASVDPGEFDELSEALGQGNDGHANGLIDHINRELAASLNFPRHWVQDRDFRLVGSPREYELALTIRDRTQTEYTFGERSQGLQYFLSYYVQLLAHEPPANGRGEILLMDEPDSYLSSEGQRDLLRILGDFAEAATAGPRQVLYVTHSPFLIDRNHADRIRVLDKGLGDEGTRVVNDAGRNHYEPLRTALGLIVGEAVFIGNANLVVEGQADQVLLAGLSRQLGSSEASKLDYLDLNDVTIVHAGGADHVPYVVRLARGRDVDQPAVVAFLDSDADGDSAAQELRGASAQSERLLPDRWIVQIGEIELPNAADLAPRSLEDLVPPPLAAEAVARYSRNLLRADEATADRIRTRAIETIQASSIFEGASAALREAMNGAKLAKVGFARSVLEAVAAEPDGAESARLLERGAAVLRRLHEALADARTFEERERASQRFTRRKREFATNHPREANRDDGRALVVGLLRDLQDFDSAEAEVLRQGLGDLIREFNLDEEPRKQIDGYSSFLQALTQIQYAPRRAASRES